MKSQNQEWIERSRRAVWHPATQMRNLQSADIIADGKSGKGGGGGLIPVARGDGAWLIDFDGRRILDAVSSWWVNLFGHCNSKIADAVCAQAKELEHVMLAGFTHRTAVELSEKLSAAAPRGLGHAFYASDGASAVEIALKMSAHAWINAGRPQKNQFVCAEGGYHGETLGALGVTDIPLYRDIYSPLLRPAKCVKSPDFRLAESGEYALQFAKRCAAELREYLAKENHSIAAFIIEPLVQGAGGMAMHHPEYVRDAAAACREFGVHFIADEIAVGFGRTGTMFACEQGGASPDFLCLSKGITGGFLPLSAVLCQDDIFQKFLGDDFRRAFWHSHSYAGNPLACAAALATLGIFEEENVICENRRRAQYLSDRAKEIAKHPYVFHFRNCGMIWAFEFRPPHSPSPLEFAAAALDEGILLRPLGDTVYWMPPYILDEDEMNFLAEKTLAVIRRFS